MSLLAVDVEATGLDVAQGRCFPFILGTLDRKSLQASVWEWRVDRFSRRPSPTTPHWLHVMASHLRGHDLVFHNCLFDLKALASLGLEFHFQKPRCWFPCPTSLIRRPPVVVECGALHDTQIMSHVVNNLGADGHGLKELCKHYLRMGTEDLDILRRETARARREAQRMGGGLSLGNSLEEDYWMAPEAAVTYCVRDLERTLSLFLFFSQLIHPGGLASYEEELSLLPTTYRMEQAGMTIFPDRLSSLKSSLLEDSLGQQQALYRMGISNPNSSKELTQWLSHSTLTRKRSTEKGTYISTSEESLSVLLEEAHQRGLSPEREVLEALQRYRKAITGIRYLEQYEKLLDPSRGKVFPSWNQVGTRFTRYSSSRPNGQNVSKKSDLPIRGIYGPPPGKVWLDPDYQQLELRIFAVAARDVGMQEAFQKGYDFHSYTAERMFGLPADRITPDQRRVAKATNFKVIYGGLNNSPPEYARQFPKAAEFMREAQRLALEQGFVETLGFPPRRIHVPLDRPYIAVDAIVQSTAGMIVKRAMRKLAQRTDLIDWEESFLIANIHDQLVLEFPSHWPILEIAREVREIMQLAGEEFGVVTPVDMSLVPEGHSWKESRKLGDLSHDSKTPLRGEVVLA